MEVHNYEKAWFVASMVLIVGFIGTIAYGAVGPGVAMVDDSGGTIDVNDVADSNFEQTNNFCEPGVYQADDGSYDVYVVAARFAFSPGTAEAVEVPTDTRVTFHVTSADVMHGFNLAGTNVNTMVTPGQVATVTTEFNEATTYGMVCHEYCGSGHHNMAGTVRAVPKAQFDQEPPEEEEGSAQSDIARLRGGE
jgi:cytochrome c oxidase subunit 2